MADGLVVHPHRRQQPLDLHPGGVQRDQHHRVPVVAVDAGVVLEVLRGVAQAHEDRDPAVGVPDSGRPPLAAVDDHLVAVDHGGRLHVGGVGGRDVGLGHRERRADLAGQQRLQPLRPLLVGSVAQQHLHVAGVGRVAVHHQGREVAAAGGLGDRGVVDVGQALAPVGAEACGVLPRVLLRQPQVPQATCPGLGLELLDDRQRSPRVAGTPLLGQVAEVVALHGLDHVADERPGALGEVGGPGRRCEVHGREPTGRSVRRGLSRDDPCRAASPAERTPGGRAVSASERASGPPHPGAAHATVVEVESGTRSGRGPPQRHRALHAAAVTTTRARWTGSVQRSWVRTSRAPDQQMNGTASSSGSTGASRRARPEKTRPVMVVDSARRLE